MEESKMKNYEGMIIIHGDLYRIDKEKKELVDADWADYTFPISSFEVIADAKGINQMRGYYDADTRQFHSGNDFSGEDAGQLHSFTIPEILLNGKTPSQQEVAEYNQQSLASGNGYLIVDRELSDRLNGKLPVIAIDGINYQVDAANLEIRQVDRPDLKFTFVYDDFFQSTEKLYNTLTKEPVTDNSTEVLLHPENIDRLTFPMLSDLDVVGFNQTGSWATTSGLTDKDWRADGGLITNKPYLNTPQQNQDGRNNQKPHDTLKLSTINKPEAAKKRGRHL